MNPDFLTFLTNWNGQTPDSMSTGPISVPITSRSIQEELGALQPDQGGSIKDILSARFSDNGPSYGNYAQSAIDSLHGKYAPANDYAASDLATQLKGISELSRAQYQASGGGGNATMKNVQALMASDPTLSYADALSIFKSGVGQGNTVVNGQVQNIGGAPQAAGNMQFGKESGGQQADLQYAAPIATAKAQGEIAGKGEITPIQNLQKGQNQVSTMLGTISNYYDQLDQAGGAVNTNNTTGQNIGAYLGNTAPGQLQGKMAGTQTQSIRNNIEQSRPLLINAIRQATGMSAKSMDSNAELQFYLKAATDPTLDIAANKKALKMLDTLYGLSSSNTGGIQTTTANPSQANGAIDYKEYFK